MRCFACNLLCLFALDASSGELVPTASPSAVGAPA